MKRLLLPALLLTACLSAGAQIVNVKDIRAVSLPEGLLVQQSVISPDGNFAVVSTMTGTDLQRVDLSTGKAAKVTDNGSILDLKMTPDANLVVYRQRTINRDRLTMVGVQATDIATGKVTKVTDASRHQGGFSLSDAGVVNAVSKGKLKTRAVAGGKSQKETVVGINRGHLVVTINGKSHEIDPQGRGSYLWPELSPDGTRVLYYKAQSGAYTCALDGSDVQPLGYLHAAKWLDNNTVVGMQDYDDGLAMTASAITLMKTDGSATQTITTPETIALYPAASADGKHITFSDVEGKLYLVTLE